MDIEASSHQHIAIHTKLWQLLSCSATYPWSVKQLWVGIFIFLRGLMRVIKKSEVRKIIIGHVELTLIFLFDYLLCKIAILESLKVLFLDKKQKLLSVDGTWLNRVIFVEFSNINNWNQCKFFTTLSKYMGWWIAMVQ